VQPNCCPISTFAEVGVVRLRRILLWLLLNTLGNFFLLFRRASSCIFFCLKNLPLRHLSFGGRETLFQLNRLRTSSEVYDAEKLGRPGSENFHTPPALGPCVSISGSPNPPKSTRATSSRFTYMTMCPAGVSKHPKVSSVNGRIFTLRCRSIAAL